MFSTLLAKATGILGVVVVFLVGLLKYKDIKLNKSESENAVYKKEDEITDDMHLAEIDAEKKRDKDLENIDDSDWRNGI